MELVRSTVLPRTALALYMPVPEQRDAALASAKFFEENGMPSVQPNGG